MLDRRVVSLLLAGGLLVAACGGGDDGEDSADPEQPAGGSATTAGTTTTIVPAIDDTTPGVEAMCDAIRSTPTPESGVEGTLRRQLDRWSAVAPVAPDLLAGYAQALVGFYERGIAVREEFDFDLTALAQAGRTNETVATAEEQVATVQMEAAVATLCDQDPPGTFELVEVDEAMVAFCAHFELNGTVVVQGDPGSAAYNEEFWTRRAELWQDAVALAPPELIDNVETYAARYDRIIEAYEPGDWDTTEAIGNGVLRAREADAAETAALTAVSDYLFDSCEVLETGDLGGTIVR